MNEVANKPEYIFVTYDDVIRTHVHKLVSTLLPMKSDYGKFINYNAIENKKAYEISQLAQNRISYNLLKHLSINNTFDADLTLLNVLDNIDNAYIGSPVLAMGNALSILAVQPFCKKIYLYSPSPSEWIKSDVKDIINDGADKIEFVSGTFIDTINNIQDPITLYVVNAISMVDEIVDKSRHQFADILLGDYGYNYTLTEEKKLVIWSNNLDERMKDRNFRMKMFAPYYREQIDPKV